MTKADSPVKKMTGRIRLCEHGPRALGRELWTKPTSKPLQRPPW